MGVVIQGPWPEPEPDPFEVEAELLEVAADVELAYGKLLELKEALRDAGAELLDAAPELPVAVGDVIGLLGLRLIGL